MIPGRKTNDGVCDAVMKIESILCNEDPVQQQESLYCCECTLFSMLCYINCLLPGVKSPDSALSILSNHQFAPLPPQEKQQVITGAVMSLTYSHLDMVTSSARFLSTIFIMMSAGDITVKSRVESGLSDNTWLDM